MDVHNGQVFLEVFEFIELCEQILPLIKSKRSIFRPCFNKKSDMQKQLDKQTKQARQLQVQDASLSARSRRDEAILTKGVSEKGRILAPHNKNNKHPAPTDEQLAERRKAGRCVRCGRVATFALEGSQTPIRCMEHRIMSMHVVEPIKHRRCCSVKRMCPQIHKRRTQFIEYIDSPGYEEEGQHYRLYSSQCSEIICRK